MTKIKLIQGLKKVAGYYVVSMGFLIAGTASGAFLTYQVVKPTIIEVSNQCITALKEAYSS